MLMEKNLSRDLYDSTVYSDIGSKKCLVLFLIGLLTTFVYQ